MKSHGLEMHAATFKRSCCAATRAIVFLLLCGPAAAQPTNFEVLRALCRQIALRADSVLNRKAEFDVILAHHAAVEEQTLDRMLSASLFETFSQSARQVFTGTDSSTVRARARVTVKFKIMASELNYKKLAKAGWLRKAPTRRTARVIADFDVYEAQAGRIYFQGPLAASSSDTLQVEANKLETPSLPYTAGVWQTVENRRSWLEPVLLTAATGAIIYAFYSLRSQ